MYLGEYRGFIQQHNENNAPQHWNMTVFDRIIPPKILTYYIMKSKTGRHRYLLLASGELTSQKTLKTSSSLCLFHKVVILLAMGLVVQ